MPDFALFTYEGQKYGTKIRRPAFLDRTSLSNSRNSYPTLNTFTIKSYCTMSPQHQELEHQTSSTMDFALTIHPVQHSGTAGNEENNATPNETSETEQEPISFYKRVWKKWCKFYNTNSFLILVICAILLAYAYPPLGAVYLAPQITATWIAVMFIFSECSDYAFISILLSISH